MRVRALSGILPVFAVLTVGLMTAPSATATESKSFVMSRFWHAANNVDGDCPDGLNPRYKEQWAKNLLDLGISRQEAEKLMAEDADQGEGRDFEHNKLLQLMIKRGRIDGQPVNSYAHPLSVKDPHLKP